MFYSVTRTSTFPEPVPFAGSSTISILKVSPSLSKSLANTSINIGVFLGVTTDSLDTVGKDRLGSSGSVLASVNTAESVPPRPSVTV